VQIWNARSGKALLTYIGHAGSVTAIAWSPDSKHLASVGTDSSVQVWNASTGRTVWIYCCQGWINGVTWSPDGRYVATANTSKTVQVWQSMTGTPELIYSNHHSEVLSVAWSPDGTRIASGDDDGIVRVWQAPLTCQCPSAKMEKNNRSLPRISVLSEETLFQSRRGWMILMVL
jgi:WD40 repeat protein